MDQTKNDDFNMALLTMCEQLGVKFLNSAEVLKDETGYGQADFYAAGDIHLKSSGLKAMLNYLRTHAYQTEDRPPGYQRYSNPHLGVYLEPQFRRSGFVQRGGFL